MKAGIPVCLLMLLVSFIDGLVLKKFKRAPDASDANSLSATVNRLQRSAWDCHPGCKKFCLSSCKRSCCATGAPNYTPDMFPQLVSYQRSLPPPPPPPPSCPIGCPTTCYPSCDAGCCFPVSELAAYSQYPAGHYGPGYVRYDTGTPCAAQGCSESCAPLCKPDCCRSQALNLSIRPGYLPGSSTPAKPSKPVRKPAKAYPKKKKEKKVNKARKKVGFLCISKCQELCKPVCRFDCCLPTHKFPKKHAAHRSRPFKSNKAAPKLAPKAATLTDIRPVASPQSVPDIKLVVPPSGMNSPVQPTSYADDYKPDPPVQAMGPAMPVARCPGACPMECSPSCDWSCCSPYVKLTVTQSIPGPQQHGSQAVQQPSLYAAVPANPMSQVIYPTPRALVYPGLVPTQPLSCPSPTCPDACAPQCSRNCCEGMNLLPQNWDKRSSKPDGK